MTIEERDPLIELRVGRSPSPRYRQTKLRAAAFAGFVDLDRGGFTLTVRLLALSRFELDELAAICLSASTWKHTTAVIAGRMLGRFDLAYGLRCWCDRRGLPPRKQAKHCGATPSPPDKRTVPEGYRPPCRMRLTDAVCWGDHAPGGITDHASMAAAMVAAAASHPFAWCPAFDVEPALVQIRKLPASRERTRAREQAKRERREAEWLARRADLSRQLQEIRDLDAQTAWLELMADRIEAHGSEMLSRDDWERLADATGMRELRDVPDVAAMTATQRDRLLDRLRELLHSDEDPEA